MIRVIIYKAKRGGNLTVNNYSTVKLNYNLVPRALFPGFGGAKPGKSALGTRLLKLFLYKIYSNPSRRLILSTSSLGINGGH